MKFIFLQAISMLILLMCLSAGTMQTPPQALNYQAVARDSSGKPMTNHAVALRISIHDSLSNNMLYAETFNTTTNQFGLFTLAIGTGNAIAGNFPQINWATGAKILKVEIDIAGGTNYLVMDSSELLNVPYALFSANSNFSYNVNTGVSPIGDTLQIGDSTYIVPGISLANACRPDLMVDTLPYTVNYPHAGDNPYNTDLYGVPKFIHHSYIELDKITQMSRFRSGAGHDFTDSWGLCCSEKHYSQPFSNIDWTTVKIYAPVNGVIINSTPDSIWGRQISIMPFGMPAFSVILFHVNPTTPFSPGDTIISGTQIGTHSSNQTTSDVAVMINRGGTTYQYVSYFDAMTDELFSCFMLRGVMTRDTMIIPIAAREADPLLPCNGQSFFDHGTIINWVTLH